MRKRYNHNTSVKQYQIRKRYSYKSNVIQSLDTSSQVLPNNNCMNFHENEYEDNNEENDNGENDNNEEDEYEEDNNEQYERDEEDDSENEEDDDDEDNDEDNNEDNNDNEENESNEDNNECLEDPIVDAPINYNQMLNTNGSFDPYFENITSALLFCWMQKHNICKLK